MKTLTVVLAIAVAVLLGGRLMPIVHGQSGFSNANLSGIYAFSFIGTDGDQTQFSVITLQHPGDFTPCVVNGVTECLGIFTDPNTGVTTGYAPNYVTDTLNLPILRPLSIAGQFVADGAGNISSGSGFVFKQQLSSSGNGTYSVVDNSCNFTLSGNYSVPSSGTGSMTLNISGPCINGPHPEMFTILLGALDKKTASETGVAYSAVNTNPGTFASFLNGTFVLQQ